MTMFWIVTAVLAVLAGLLVLAGARSGAGEAFAGDSEVSGAELTDLDRLKERGLLDEASWSTARAEAGRRLLASTRQAEPARVGPHDRRLVLAGIISAGAGALAVYAAIGAPGAVDQAYDKRVDEWASQLDTLQAPQLAAVAARVVSERPNDAEALAMLGAARFEAGDPIAAASAFRRALALRPQDAQSWSRLGESLVRANGGTVDGDAEAAFREALRLDPGQLGSRYFLGEAALARADVAQARSMWLPLIAALPSQDPRRADLEARLAGASS
jgi:cytochrome c-type biogenesis protein CcmH